LGPATQTTLELRWQAGTDNVGVHHYNVFRGNSAAVADQVKIGETTALSYVYTGLACGTSYSLALQAEDAAGNKSNLAEGIWYPRTTLACGQSPPPPSPGDTEPPSAPSNLQVTSSTTTSIGLAWKASTDNVGIAGYDVYVNGVKIWTTSGTSFPYMGLSCATTYTVAVEAYDAAGNRSQRATITTATSACPPPPPGDTEAPTTPGNLHATSATATSITIAWNASSDNVGVAGYRPYNDGSVVGSTSTTSYTVSGLSCGSSNTLGVEAYDAAGNRSQRATIATVTSACPPPPPPPPPPGQVLFNGDFDTGNESQWTLVHEFTSDRFRVVTSDGAVTPRQGTYMGRYEIRDEPTSWCATSNPPCNVTMDDQAGTPRLPVIGQDTYLGLSVYFPSDFDFESPAGTNSCTWNAFAEVHAPPGAGEQNQAPIHLSVNNCNPASPTIEADLHNNLDFTDDYTANLGPVTRGQWIDLAVRVLWKYDNTGIYEGWRNGVKLFSSGPIKTLGDTVDYVYPMAGFYRNAFASNDVLYIDGFKIGTTLESVTP
jgi:chitodextrinase